MKRNAIPSIAISVVTYLTAFFIYTRFDAVKDPSINDRSHFAQTMLVLVILQGFFSIGSRKPVTVLLFIWFLVALLSISFNSFSGSGSIRHQAMINQHMDQIMQLKVILGAALPILNALACHIYLNWQRNRLNLQTEN